MNFWLRKVGEEMRLPVLYMLLFPCFFGIGWVLAHLQPIFAFPLALLLLMYFPALLALGKTRQRLAAFTVNTLRDGCYLIAVFGLLIVAQRIGIKYLDSKSLFPTVYPVILCVKTFTTFRAPHKTREASVSSEQSVVSSDK